MPPTRCSTSAWRRGAPASRITLVAFGMASAIALPAAWGWAGAPAPRGADLAAVAYTGIVTAGLAYLLFSHALRHISPATGVTLALGEPVVAFALAVTLLGEAPAAAAYAGLALLVAGVLLVVRQELAGVRIAPRRHRDRGARSRQLPA